jgi:hypothetical protein
MHDVGHIYSLVKRTRCISISKIEQVVGRTPLKQTDGVASYGDLQNDRDTLPDFSINGTDRKLSVGFKRPRQPSV